MDNEQLTAAMREFSVSLENAQQFSATMSKARCRIFYKGINRNGTYISDEFAEKLIKTLPYTPVKGIYDGDDYTDHGASRSLGRIYGIVMADPNFAWEKHVDDDGVERTYACADVLIYSALYKEAKDIAGKSQSMELYAPSIRGDWKYVEGRKVFAFDDACFLGLEVLGDNTEPCFEGAAFFSLYNELMSALNEYNKLIQTFAKGGHEMDNTIFRLSDECKASMIWNLLNDEVDAEGYKKCCHSLVAVYDDYAVSYNMENGEYERVYYKKNDECNSLEISERKKCYIVDVDEEEKRCLDALHAMKKTCCELQADYDKAVEENQNYSQKNEELTQTVATLTQEKEDATAKYTEAQATIETQTAELEKVCGEVNSLTAERDSLVSYKHDAELAQKQAVIDSYASLLSDETIATYVAKIEEYADTTTLDKDLAYELKNSRMDVFTKTQAPKLIPNVDNSEPTGIEAILAKYKK